MTPTLFPARVVNVRTAAPGSFVYIGRALPGRFKASVFGNPFKVGVDGKRGECVDLYRRWLAGDAPKPRLAEARLVILAAIPHLREQVSRGLTLGCFCAPLACHGDVLLELIDKLETP